MRDTLFTRVETNEYLSGLRNRGFSERQLLFFCVAQVGGFILNFINDKG